MKRMIFMISVFCLFLTAALIFSCGNQGDSGDKKEIKLGCLAYSEPMVQWIKEGLDSLGYRTKVIMFDMNQLPATALRDGSIDGIIANHKPWIETFNRENNSALEMVQPYHYYSFFALYSVRYKKTNQIPRNAKIAVPGDPSNLSRSLIFLEKAGLLTLKEKSGIFYTLMDIKDNPKKIKIIETEILQTARSIEDVDAIISPAFYVGQTRKADPGVYLMEDPQNKDYPLGLIVRNSDLSVKWVKDAIGILRSAENMKRFDEHYKGMYKLFR